jgi:rhodanese-related sulfurtransferase
MALPGFLLAAATGAALWAGLALGTGWLFRNEVQTLIRALDAYTGNALILVAGLTACWLGWKLAQKYRFRKRSAIPHILVDELLAAMKAQPPLLLLDLRGPGMVAEAGPIPGATVVEHDRLAEAVGNWPKDQAIVTLCACPEDAGAILAALRLIEDGYQSVRPLKGGYEAWRAAVNTHR